MANANHGDIVDYAMPLMKLEKLSKEIHNLCLDKKYKEAGELCPQIVAEARVLSAVMALMENNK